MKEIWIILEFIGFNFVSSFLVILVAELFENKWLKMFFHFVLFVIIAIVLVLFYRLWVEWIRQTIG